MNNDGGKDRDGGKDHDQVKGFENIPFGVDSSEMSQQQTAVFGEDEPAYTVGVAADRDPTYNSGATDNVPLADFLRRPILVYDSNMTLGAMDTWEVGEHFNFAQFDPWILFQSDPRVRHKMNNFAFASFDLKVRFLINGSPFQYGRIMAYYVPYGRLGTTIAESRNQVEEMVKVTQFTAATGSKENALRYYSTHPHVQLDPGSHEPAEMTLPFMWHNNFIPVAGSNGWTGEDLQSLGVIRMTNLNYLRRANPEAPATVKVRAYCWAENIKLATPTEFEPVSMKDEYPNGIVSAPASAVAGAAGKLKDVPVIGKYARATEIGAGKLAAIARLFGFATPPMAFEPEERRLSFTARHATVVGADGCHKLTLDPKQELSVDPRTVGVPPHDELAFKSIVTREQFLTRCDWRGSGGTFTTPGAHRIIFASAVSPSLPSTTSGPPTLIDSRFYRQVMDTPAGHLSRPFAFWKGGVTFRVEVIASPYHSGRLQLQFDPFVKRGTYAVSDFVVDDVNARYTAILDLSKSREIEFTIPWTSHRPWLRTSQDPTNLRSNFAPTVYDQTTFDLHELWNIPFSVDESVLGMFVVTVVNDLRAPMDTSAIASTTSAPAMVNVYVKMTEDTCFAQPDEHNAAWPKFQYRPGRGTPVSLIEGEPVSMVMGVSEHKLFDSTDHEDDHKVFFGERVTSIRSLIKRFSLVDVRMPRSWTSGGGTSQPPRSGNVISLNYGWLHPIPRNWQTDNAVLNTSFMNKHSFLSYFSPAFLMCKGATRSQIFYASRAKWEINGNAVVQMNVEDANLLVASRDSTIDPSLNTINLSSTLDSWMITRDNFFNRLATGLSGQLLTNTQTRRFIEFETPYYQGQRFSLAVFLDNEMMGANLPLLRGPIDSQLNFVKVTGVGQIYDTTFFRYFAAGEDYSLFYYLAPPPFYFEMAAP